MHYQKHGLRLLAACVLMLGTASALAAPGNVFPRPSSLEPQINFWRQVFGVYSTHQMIFHDDRWPGKIYKVLDFRPLVLAGESENEIWRRMQREDKDTKIRLQAMLWHIYKVKADPNQLDAEEQRIVRMFANVRGGNAKYVEAQHHLRSQLGLKEKTRQAIIRSGYYLDHMEDVFRQYQLPVLLTRLPIVESSFDATAYSKVGAAGLWQFIPSSARHYMRLNRVVDDRRDPWFSTEAAAKHLRDDYSALGNWGLAVTAYNHGRAGVARAVKEVGSTNIADIIHNYSSASFGFASRNFYTEFLAAVDVERNRVRYFGPVLRQQPRAFDVVSTQHYVNFSTLAKTAGVSKDRLAELNPAFKPAVLSGRLRVPPQSQLRVPDDDAAHFRQAYASLDSKLLFAQQRRLFAQYRVARGDNLGYIAQRYNTSVSNLRHINGLHSNRIRIGQRLRVPLGRQPQQLASRPAPRTQVHTVQRGDSLGELAQRYGTSVAAIKQLNGLHGSSIRIGQKLRIRGNGDGVRVASAGYKSHTVRRGQTLSGIAQRYGTSVSRIKAANNLAGMSIRAGQTLKIPSS